MILGLEIITFTLWLLISIYDSTYLMAFFQLEEYDNLRFSKWFIKKVAKVNRIIELIGVPFFVFAGITNSMPLLVAGTVVSIISFLISFRKIFKDKARLVKPLVYTSRTKRILFTVILLTLGVSVTTFISSWNSQISIGTFATGAIVLLLLGQLTAFYLIFANVILIPIEKSIQTYYLRSAQKIIRSINPIVIGVTGSFCTR